MMRYGRPTDTDGLSANFVLSTDLKDLNVPSQYMYSRCISKRVAIDSEADADAMSVWEQSQDRSKNTIPFPYNRLMPPQAIFPDDSSNPFAELYDDKTLTWESTKTEGGDSWKAGYSYELVNVVFSDPQYQQQHANEPIIATPGSDADGPTVEYTKGWLKVVVKKDVGDHTKIAYELDDPRYRDPNWERYYFQTEDGYANIGGTIRCYDLLGENTGADKYVTMYWLATPIDGIINYSGEYFKCVQPNKTNVEFSTILYHSGINSTSTSWVDYPAQSTSQITINHTSASNSTLDIVAVTPGLATNGTYWDSTGWVHSAQSDYDFNSWISISKENGGSSITINCNAIKQYAENAGTGVGIPIYVYGCWDKMSQGNTSDSHLIAPSGTSTTISASGMSNKTVSVISAGNLNKTLNEESIRNNYTCLYKIFWGTGLENFSVKALEGSDVAYINTGVYGLIYPTQNFTRSLNQNDTMRNYTGDSNFISTNDITVYVSSTINGSNVPFTVSQYIPGENYHETYTINGTNLTDSGSVNITGNSFVVNFGSIESGQARWLKLQQEGSPEYANLCFTFNQ